MNQFTDNIRAALAAETKEDSAGGIRMPRDPEVGDFVYPCFLLARQLNKQPPTIAAELEPKLNMRMSGITANGPYINFRIDRELLARTVSQQIILANNSYGNSNDGEKKVVVIDMSSPNIAKPNYSLLEDEAGAMFVHLGRFGDVLAQAARNCEPSEVACYLLVLCRSVNSWYARHHVLGQKAALCAARVCLVRCAKIVLRNGLRILGMCAPAKM